MSNGQGVEFLIIPIVPLGSSLSSFIGFFPTWKGDLESNAWKEIFAQGRPQMGPRVLAKSPFPYYLPLSQLHTDQVQCWWLEAASEGFWLLVTETYPLIDISSPLQKWVGPCYKEAACIL